VSCSLTMHKILKTTSSEIFAYCRLSIPGVSGRFYRLSWLATLSLSTHWLSLTCTRSDSALRFSVAYHV
jgi:hypothetical protein